MTLRPLIGALFYLQTRSLANALRIRWLRLRQPKYLIGAVVGLGYLYTFFFRHLFGGWGSAPSPWGDSSEWRSLFQSGAAVGVFAIAVSQWIFCGSRAALQFSEAELAFLLPAPMSRRMLIRYKLLRSQLGTLLSAVIFTLVTGRFARDGLVVIHVLSGWMVLTALGLHGTGVSFTMQRLTERGLSTVKFRAAVLLLLLLFVSGVFLWMRALPPLSITGEDPLASGRQLGGWLGQALTSGPAPWLLAPFRWLVRPWFAAGPGSFAMAALPVLVMLGLLFRWVERSEVGFEEASLDLARKRTETVTAMRSGKGAFLQRPRTPAPNPFVLAPTGFAPLSLMWNHLIHARVTPRRVGLLVGGVLLATMGLRWAPLPEAVRSTAGVVLLIAFAALALLGGTHTSSGLRRDLGMLEVMKGYPLPGWQIVLGELLGPALVILGLQWLAALGAVITLPSLESLTGGRGLLLGVGTLCAVVVVAPLNLVNALVPAAATLLFPAWARPGRDIQQPGFEAMGQRIVFGAAQLILVAVSLVPAAGLGVGGYLLLNRISGPVSGLAAAALLASVMLSVEAWFGIRLLGKLFDRYDGSEDR
ncbi:MAG: hypothetical protein RIS76_3118 [Verrucomicrobiota bacterium]